MDAPGVVPGVSHSGEVALGVLPIDAIVVSVGEVDDEALVGFFEDMVLGIETSFSWRTFGRESTTISSSEEPFTSELFWIDRRVLGVLVALETLRFDALEDDRLLV